MKRDLIFTQCGHGQWMAKTTYYGKDIWIHFTDAETFDLIKSKERGYKKAATQVITKIIENHKLNNGKY